MKHTVLHCCSVFQTANLIFFQQFDRLFFFRIELLGENKAQLSKLFSNQKVTLEKDWKYETVLGCMIVLC